MRTAPRPPAAAPTAEAPAPAPDAIWEPFGHRGRPFLRGALPGPRGREALAFAVAREIAGRYRVEGLFDIGSATVLLRARDLRTGRPVLVKTTRADAVRLPPDLPDSSIWTEEVRRLRHALQTERRLLVRLRNAGCNGIPHPNDYAYDHNPALEEPPFAGRIDPSLVATEPYLVLPHLAGTPLDELLATQYPRGMPELRAVGLIRPIVEILAILQEPWRLRSGRTWHCVYQDLKPDNILIDPAGRPVLLDFGGCQVVVDGVPVLEGGHTPGYSPPECAGPPRVLLPCADVYSIGATLHHLLSGVDPRDRRPSILANPGSLPGHVSPGLRDLVARCLAPRPSDRPADARQVARALDALNLVD
ncbi:MAG: hypothetical protein IRY99_01000 [Isosphaeraceae bacterium]|nr:hypothetical protein [Isosphaeraceae bacterium]